jgi:rhamnogalacturonyl hydrolase YesR
MDVDGPFLAALARTTGEAAYFDQAVDELLGYARALQSEGSLLFHGFERDCGRNGQLWARGQGWALMGLVDTLILLPRDHAGWSELHQRLVALVDALGAAQEETGLWHTVVDRPETYLESTLAAMAAYALREGFTHGVLDVSAYSEIEAKARAAMHREIAPDGALQRVSDATPIGALAMYATRPFGVFPWGQGPLLLALCQESS